MKNQQDQSKTSAPIRQQQQQNAPKADHLLSVEETGGQPGQQNAGSGQGKNSLNHPEDKSIGTDKSGA